MISIIQFCKWQARRSEYINRNLLKHTRENSKMFIKRALLFIL